MRYEIRRESSASRKWRKVSKCLPAALCLIWSLTALGDQPSKYLRVGSLPPAWQMALRHHGDRMQKPGKERLVFAGTVTRSGSSAPFQVIHELPNQVRYQEGSGKATTFDGNNYGNGSEKSQKDDGDLVETLAYDTPETFLSIPANGAPVRHLGSHFRLAGKPGVPYTGPVYEVYLAVEPVKQPGKVKQQAKYYYVNADTHLVERVHYQDADNPSTQVEILLENWTTVSNNRVPQSIRRLENGVEVLRLAITSASLGPSVADGAFQKP